MSRQSRTSTTFQPSHSVWAASAIISSATAAGRTGTPSMRCCCRYTWLASSASVSTCSPFASTDRRAAPSSGAVSVARRAGARFVTPFSASRRSHAASPQTISTADASVRSSSSRKSRRPIAEETRCTPFSANFASVCAFTIPAPNFVAPHGPQHSALTLTRPLQRSHSWQHRRFISSFAVA